MKRSIAVFVAVCMTAGVLFVTASPAAALSSYENDFASRHNSIRASHGRKALAVYGDLVDIARRHSGRMASEGRIWHNPNLTSEVKNWQVVGENVGMGPSVPDLMDAFMNSPGHRANILDGEYNQFGVGVVVKDGTIYVTVVFALRSSSSGSTTAKKPSSTTTSKSSTISKPRSTATSPRSTTTKPASKPAAAASAPVAPAPVAVPVAPPVRTVDMLVRMIRMDS
ncbi:MAG TPA: CAP domain-containing protein [Actinomycetota bacterium]|nr:CAP domain-containing protein [Actinomycetota bacterium]